MKKLLVSIVILLLCVILSLTSCNISSIANMLDVYTVTVTDNTRDLAEPLMPFYKAGDIVRVKAYTMNDASVHVFVNDREVEPKPWESGMKYWIYEFVMPSENITVHITHDPFYGRENYTFDELLYWIEFIDNSVFNKTVNGVSVRIDNYSDRTSFVETRYSAKQVDIDSFKAIFDQPLIKVGDKDIGNTGAYTTYCFYEDGELFDRGAFGELTFRDNFFSHFYNETSLPQPFRFEDIGYVLPTIEDPDYVTYSFRRENRVIYVKKYGDDSFSQRYDNLSFVEFVPYDGETINIEPVFYIDTECGRINLLNNDVFEINGEYYEVVSGSWAYKSINLDSKK